VIVLSGPTGRLSQTPDEANKSNGANPPPMLAPTVTTTNHWFRLEFPFAIARSAVLENSPLTAPFSYLNGAITVTDVTGDHVPGLAMVNGVDVFGVNHAGDAGFPHDVQGGKDKNLGSNVLLYVADLDRNLQTIAAFGYKLDPLLVNKHDEITDSLTQHVNGPLDTVRITLAEVAGVKFDAVWSFHIGTTKDVRKPYVIRVTSEVKDPTQPLNAASADVHSTFLVEFSEPMVPNSVGEFAFSGNTYYNANLPRYPFVAPFPDVTMTATVGSSVGTLYVPFDCKPINTNNLATYRFTPVIDLPAKSSLDLLVRSLTQNTNAGNGVGRSAIDLAGNNYDGQDANGDGTPDGTDLRTTFAIGPGAGVVNIPVSPEVVYWLPASGNGVGAVDLDGMGLTTNAPFANVNDRSRAWMITKLWINGGGCEVNPGGANLSSGIGMIAHPGGAATPLDACTGLPMKEFGHNRYWYPVGTGSYLYGPGPNASRSEPWEAPADPGNTGTPAPGVNEGSSGFETICRDSTGDAILTGSQFGRVGVINDLVVGDFLDVVYSDNVNPHAFDQLHVGIFNKGATGRGNLISDPPAPNPPPIRYWAGLPTIGVVLDHVNGDRPPLLLEGEEVFGGWRYPTWGFQQVKANPNNVAAPDVNVFPGFGVGPGLQSATQIFTYSSRQQIGNFLYATDASTHEVRVLNSNTMRVITSISTPDPTGLAISPDLTKLYVTNSSADNVSVIACDPTKDNFHQELARVPVGRGPRAVCVQPDGEDVFVCNYLGNTVSIVSTANLAVRKTLDSLMSGPFDVEATPRQIEPTSPNPNMPTMIGFACGVYFAYVSNSTGNNVCVYESGPDGPQGIGINDVRGALPDANTNPNYVLIDPRGLCYSPFANPSGLYAGGCFVAHRDENGFGRVSHIQFTTQAIFGPIPVHAPPNTAIPPGFRDRKFDVVGTWGNTDSNHLVGSIPTDVTLSDFATTAYHNSPSAAPNLANTSVPPVVERTGRLNSKHPMRLNTPSCYPAVTPDRLYVSFEDTDTIQVLAPTSVGVILNTLPGTGVGGVKKLGAYFRQ
jgi:YVTN family beta-propeller protein